MKKEAYKIIKILKKKKIKIAFAESCTGGMLSSAITSVSGSSKVFSLGLVTYSNDSKIKILKISKQTIKKYGAVSKQVCKTMVINVAKIGKTFISASVTGIAGPGGGSKTKPVGLVYIGFKKGKTILVKENKFKSKNRNSIQKSTVKEVIKIILNLITFHLG